MGFLRTAHRPEPVDHSGVQPHVPLAALVGLRLDGHAAERQGGGDGLERWRR